MLDSSMENLTLTTYKHPNPNTSLRLPMKSHGRSHVNPAFAAIDKTSFYQWFGLCYGITLDGASGIDALGGVKDKDPKNEAL
jgi:hypothetical protein